MQNAHARGGLRRLDSALFPDVKGKFELTSEKSAGAMRGTSVADTSLSRSSFLSCHFPACIPRRAFCDVTNFA